MILFGNKKNLYKANMHCHSTLSDGAKTPEQLKEDYKAHGYSILAITDHEAIYNNSHLDDDDFITLTSAEIAIKEDPAQSSLGNCKLKVCHLNLYAKEQDNNDNFFFSTPYFNRSSAYFVPAGDERRKQLVKPETEIPRTYTAEGINALIKSADEHGFFVAYNHPRWSLENYGEYSKYEGLWGVEIYNTSCNVGGLYEYDINVFDDFLRDGKKVFATSGDDNHNKTDDSYGTFVMVNADRLVYSEVVNSLLKGDFYTSTGPEIYEISQEDMTVKVKCSHAYKIMFSTEGRRTKAVFDTDEAEFILCNDPGYEDGYFRISVVDYNGKIANSQAYKIF